MEILTGLVKDLEQVLLNLHPLMFYGEQLLKTLDFLPLLNADYSGGIIIYDWYSQTNNPKEQIKISVQFLSNELRSDSIKITAHKKICDNYRSMFKFNS